MSTMRSFLLEHLNMFALNVVDSIRKNANTAAYKALAEFTLGFINAITTLTESTPGYEAN